jgi:Ca-activated chloride channel homolog
MSFHAPVYLAALAILPLAACVYVLWERRAKSTFAPPALMPSVLPRRAGWRRHAPVGMYGIAAAVLILALARPHRMVTVETEQATVVIAIDRSGSMKATDVTPNRLEAAKRAANAFLDHVPAKVRVGALTFNSAASILAAPTTDHNAVQAAVATITPKGTTATGEAIETALRMIKSSRRPGQKPPPAAIVLLSDGKSDRGVDPLKAADDAKVAGVPVTTVALGTDHGTIQQQRKNGSSVTLPVPPDPQQLAQIARRSGGQAFAVADAARLKQVYENLGSQVAKHRQPREVTGMFAGGALLLMAVAAAASLRWFGRFV